MSHEHISNESYSPFPRQQKQSCSFHINIFQNLKVNATKIILTPLCFALQSEALSSENIMRTHSELLTLFLRIKNLFRIIMVEAKGFVYMPVKYTEPWR